METHTKTQTYAYAFAKLDFQISWVGRREPMTPAGVSLGPAVRGVGGFLRLHGLNQQT